MPVFAVHVRIVGDERLIRVQRFHHRVPALADLHHALVIQRRPHVSVEQRGARQALVHVELLKAQRRALQGVHMRRDLRAHLVEKLILQPLRLVLRAHDALFELAQFLGRITLAVRERLAADKAIRHQRKIGFRDLDIITEHAVILDAEVADAGLFALPRLKIDQPLLALGVRAAVFVQLRVIPGPDDAGVVRGKRRVVRDRRVEHVQQVLHRIQQNGDRIQRFRADELPHRFRLAERPPERQAVPRIQRLVGDLGQQPLHVVHLLQALAHRLAEDRLPHQRFHGVQAGVDLILFEQRLFHIAAQQAAAHRGHRMVDHAEQRSLAALPAQGLRQFKVPDSILVQRHGMPRRHELDARDVPEGVLLRIVQVRHQRPRGTHGRLVGDAEAQGLQRRRFKV